MAYSLALKDKDLHVSSARMQTVKGVDKLKQDIFLWITEAYNVDRFVPGYGSTMSSYVGQLNTRENAFEIEVEVHRVLANLQRYQRTLYSQNRSVYSLDELLDTVRSVRAVRNLDSLRLYIGFSTAAAPDSTYTTEVEVQ